MEGNSTSLIKHYFSSPNLPIKKFEEMMELYRFWNEKINVISRKDVDNLEVHHILHSLSIAKFIDFRPGTQVLDVGTGGGFPGIPLALIFPDTEFYLVDSIGKKIKVVENIAQDLGLKNIRARVSRAENLPLQPKFDFVVSRAVTQLKDFWPWVKDRFKGKMEHSIPNGLIALKGGDLAQEIQNFEKKVELFPLKNYFQESFFETKYILFVPGNGK